MIGELAVLKEFLLLCVVFFMILTVRYFLVAGAFYIYFYGIGYRYWKDRKLNNERKPSKKQLIQEIKWSLISSIIFAIVGVLTYWLYMNGHTAIYSEVGLYGYWYLPVSLVLVLFLHETYYYWVHRWMHNPKVFRIVHKVHHNSISTSPWTAFSFHPWEGFIEAIILPVLLIFIPIHYMVLLTYLLLMTLSSVINHLDIEVYPKRFQKHWLGQWFIGASHHHYHHKEFTTNYGLYFTFWDRWMSTESDKYQESLGVEATVKR